LLDTNILVYAADQTAAFHEPTHLTNPASGLCYP
jgi:hypothetical protein